MLLVIPNRRMDRIPRGAGFALLSGPISKVATTRNSDNTLSREVSLCPGFDLF